MRRLRWIYYRRDDEGAAFGAHLAPPGPRTLCNRWAKGPAWRSGERPEGRVYTCKRCLEVAGTCSVCGQPLDAHFDERNKWTGCAPAEMGVA
jgi:hypothetical protein